MTANATHSYGWVHLGLVGAATDGSVTTDELAPHQARALAIELLQAADRAEQYTDDETVGAIADTDEGSEA
jgi:hypothetical protein